MGANQIEGIISLCPSKFVKYAFSFKLIIQNEYNILSRICYHMDRIC